MIMPAWRDWFKKIMKIKSKFCVIKYNDMKTDILGSLRPVVKFLGFEMNKGVSSEIKRFDQSIIYQIVTKKV